MGKKIKYRIYSINRSWRLLNFWTLGVGAYSRLGAIHHSQQVYSMWSLVRDFSENDKIFRREKKYVE